MIRDLSILASQQKFLEERVRENSSVPSLRDYWESKKRENEALMEAQKLEDAFVEGKKCTTQKQREAARREYRKHLRTLANQRVAEIILKV